MPAGRCGGQEVTMLQLKNIKKVYNGVPILNGISLDIGKGEIVSILGPSGSGKTTLLNIIAGKEGYDSGNIVFRRDLRVDYLEQDPQYPEELTGRT